VHDCTGLRWGAFTCVGQHWQVALCYHAPDDAPSAALRWVPMKSYTHLLSFNLFEPSNVTHYSFAAMNATARNRLLTIIVGRFWSGPF